MSFTVRPIMITSSPSSLSDCCTPGLRPWQHEELKKMYRDSNFRRTRQKLNQLVDEDVWSSDTKGSPSFSLALLLTLPLPLYFFDSSHYYYIYSESRSCLDIIPARLGQDRPRHTCFSVREKAISERNFQTCRNIITRECTVFRNIRQRHEQRSA